MLHAGYLHGMRASIRETGSILVNAPRDRVYELLRSRLATEPDLREAPDRIEAFRPGVGLTTFILRDAPGGTRLIHGRSRDAPMVPTNRPRDELRAAVAAELFDVQRVVEAWQSTRL